MLLGGKPPRKNLFAFSLIRELLRLAPVRFSIGHGDWIPIQVTHEVGERLAAREGEELMFVHRTYFMWTRGRFTASHTMALNPDRRYLVTGALAGKSGASTARCSFPPSAL